MTKYPRIAIGAIKKETDHQPILWALLDVLERSGADVQTFRSQACFVADDDVNSITGQCHRHLDTWLMSSELCRTLFRQGAQSCDLAVLEGCFETNSQISQERHSNFSIDDKKSPGHESPLHTGGNLKELCDWLDVPRIGVLDVARIQPCEISIQRPPVDALLLDGVTGMKCFCRLQTQLEALWEIPVLGALESLPHVRLAIESPHCEGKTCRTNYRRLGNNLLRYLDFGQLMTLAKQRDFPNAPALHLPTLAPDHKLSIAVAFDDAFHCYFADALDMLEMGGATIKTFSPLRDESLPQNTNLVYFGYGHPEKHAWALSRNHCMHTALRDHVYQHGGVYAEGEGVAYLGQRMMIPGQSPIPMVGALPLDSYLCPDSPTIVPQEIKLPQSSWLGKAGTRIRGYLNSHWRLQPVDDLNTDTINYQQRLTFLSQKQLIGSLLNLNFAAQPDFVHRIFTQFSQSRSTIGHGSIN